MPVVEPFVAEGGVPAPSGSPTANPEALSAPGRAIAQGFGALSDQAMEFQRRYTEARRMADAANAVADASKKLGDLQFQSSKIPDRVTAMDAFNKGADQIEKDTYGGISDPLVLAHVKERVGQERVIRGLDTQNAAFDLESSKRRGDLDTHLLQYSQDAAAAPNDVLRAKIVDDANAEISGAAAAGWIHPEEAAQKKIAFGSQIEEVAVRTRMNAALDSQNPRAMDTLAKDIADPSKFPGLLPETREVLGTRVENMSYRLAMREATRIAHADAVGEKLLHKQQAHNEAVLLFNTYNGQAPKLADLEVMVDKQLISPGGLEAIHSAMDRSEKGTNDWHTVLTLQQGLNEGTTTPSDIYGARAQGKLDTPTAVEMMKTLDAKSGKGDNANEKALFNVLKTGLQGNAIENGLPVFGSDKQTAAARWGAAQGEWQRRVVTNGENPSSVLADMLPKYGSTMKPTWLDDPKFGKIGTVQDLAKVAMATARAHQAKQMGDADYWGQVELLNNYKRYFAAEAAHDQAAKIAARSKPAPKVAAPAEATP